MSPSAFESAIGAYPQWKSRVGRAIVELDKWLKEVDIGQAGAARVIQAGLVDLQTDRLRLAVVSGHGADSVALVNALCFPAVGQPILPIGLRWPLPCPLTLLWDDARNESYLRLLPIETRAQNRSLADFTADPRHWVQYPLGNLTDEQQARALLEMAETKSVNPADALRLRLPSRSWSSSDRPPAERCTIPKWRNAIVSAAHPLLKQGLVMAIAPDLPGLDRDPDITAQILSRADLLLFVIRAETGVTQTDAEIWERHVKDLPSVRQQRVNVVLLQECEDSTGASPGRPMTASPDRIAATAVALGLSTEHIMSVAARQGLAARMENDRVVLRRSALEPFEQALATRLLELKHQAVVEVLDQNVGAIVKRGRAELSSQIARAQAQLQDLEALQHKSEKVIGQVIAQTRQQREHYLKAVLQFQSERAQLLAETQLCQELLSRHNMETIFAEAHRRMVGSWTTYGLGQSMQALFGLLRQRMQIIIDESERLRKLVRTTYQGFRDEHGFELGVPKVFAPTRYHVELELLIQEVEVFRRSPVMLFHEQAGVIERFHQQIVSRGRVLFDQLRASFDPWVRDALQPIADAIEEHKATMERRLASLRQVNGSNADLKQRIRSKQDELVELTRKLTALRNVQIALYHAPFSKQPFESPARVVGRG